MKVFFFVRQGIFLGKPWNGPNKAACLDVVDIQCISWPGGQESLIVGESYFCICIRIFRSFIILPGEGRDADGSSDMFQDGRVMIRYPWNEPADGSDGNSDPECVFYIFHRMWFQDAVYDVPHPESILLLIYNLMVPFRAGTMAFVIPCCQ